MWILILAIGLPALIVLFIFGLYNSLITVKTRVDEAWSGIDVQLKRRSDLIPNLVETVKGYASHEKEVFENVTKARAALLSARNPKEAAEANNQLAGTLKTLFAVAENYPELKASENFRELQDELSDTENKIAYSRQFYNSNVLDYNVKIKQIPAVFLAGMLGFQEREFFKTAEEDKEPVKVSFREE